MSSAKTSTEPIDDSELAGLFQAGPLRAVDAIMLAVSGGTDSLALLWLYARYRRLHGAVEPAVIVTVDHGLRAESAAEAAFVAETCADLGLRHETLRWQDVKPATGRQEAAREARYELMGQRLASLGGMRRALLSAHTADDQAETLLMRLARGSGVDGLAGMPYCRPLTAGGEDVLVRPLLGVRRARLAATLAQAGLEPRHDPTNENAAYERVRIRRVLSELAPLGLTPDVLARSAERLGRAREALEWSARAFEDRHAVIRPGVETQIEAAAYLLAPEEVRIRLVRRALARHRGAHPAAELAEIERLAAGVADAVTTRSGGAERGAALLPAYGTTLGGCAVRADGARVLVFREIGRAGLGEISVAPGGIGTWDDRFEIKQARSAPGPIVVRALAAEAWPMVKPLYEKANLRAAVAMTLPSIWRDGRLVGVPDPAALGAGTADGHIACISAGTGMPSDRTTAGEADACGCTLRALKG